MQRLRSLINYRTDASAADLADFSDNDLLVRFDYTLRDDRLRRRRSGRIRKFRVRSVSRSWFLDLIIMKKRSILDHKSLECIYDFSVDDEFIPLLIMLNPQLSAKARAAGEFLFHDLSTISSSQLSAGVAEILSLKEHLIGGESRPVYFDVKGKLASDQYSECQKASGFLFDGVPSSLDCTIVTGKCYLCPNNRNGLLEGCRELEVDATYIDDRGKEIRIYRQDSHQTIMRELLQLLSELEKIAPDRRLYVIAV